MEELRIRQEPGADFTAAPFSFKILLRQRLFSELYYKRFSEEYDQLAAVVDALLRETETVLDTIVLLPRDIIALCMHYLAGGYRRRQVSTAIRCLLAESDC